MIEGSTKGQLNSFEQLEVWQKAQNLAVMVYRDSQEFPKEEMYGLTNQLRRAVASISANIAEGFGRTSIKEKLNFYSIARGSLLEVKNFIYLAARLEYIDDARKKELLAEATTVQKLLNGLLKSTKTRDV